MAHLIREKKITKNRMTTFPEHTKLESASIFVEN